MAFFEKIGSTISTAGKEVAKKTKELSDSSKINSKINEEKSNIQKKYQELGEIYYKEHVKTEENSQLKELCDSITASLNSIEDCEKQLQEVKGVAICSKCNKEVAVDVAFCNYCGNKMGE